MQVRGYWCIITIRQILKDEDSGAGGFDTYFITEFVYIYV